MNIPFCFLAGLAWGFWRGATLNTLIALEDASKCRIPTTKSPR